MSKLQHAIADVRARMLTCETISKRTGIDVDVLKRWRQGIISIDIDLQETIANNINSL